MFLRSKSFIQDGEKFKYLVESSSFLDFEYHFAAFISQNRFSKILKLHTLSLKGEDTVLVYRINQEITLTKKVYQKRKRKNGIGEPRIF
jgi:hypothetical protein